jgi:hypothetical protein
MVQVILWVQLVENGEVSSEKENSKVSIKLNYLNRKKEH